MENFTVIHETNDITKELKSFTKGTKVVPLLASESLFVGFRKTFNVMYFELSVANATPAILSATYTTANGTQALKICDETNGFTESGFITFVRPTDAIETTVQGIKKVFVEIKTDVDLDVGTTFDGVGIVLCDTNDVEQIRSNIVSRLNNGKTLISKINLAKDLIVQMLNNQGNVKVSNDVSGVLSNGLVMNSITEFDFLDVDQFRLAAAYLTAATFYLQELSDDGGDKWDVQGKRFMGKFNELFQTYLLKLDLNDDGIANEGEVENTSLIKLTLD